MREKIEEALRLVVRAREEWVPPITQTVTLLREVLAEMDAADLRCPCGGAIHVVCAVHA